MIGTTVAKYRIVALLGRGATGIVYKAVDDTLDREVAIKVLHPLYAAGGDVTRRFRAEATTLAKLSHPEIATIHELLQIETGFLMVMELVRGETLEVLAERAGPMSPQLAGHIVDGILSALEHAHRAGVVHRDLKPANVMVTEGGGIKIMDFGIARVRGAAHMTNEGCAVGTPAYMAPEQVLGDDIDGRADLYAVGLIFYRLLTGTLPFDTNNTLVMLQKQVSERPRPLCERRADLPDWCDAVIARALAKAARDRYQTAEDFRAAVRSGVGLTPTVDLSRAFGVRSRDASTDATAGAVAKTVAISHGAVDLLPLAASECFARVVAQCRAPVKAFLARANAAPKSRNAGSIAAAVCGLSTLAYWSATTSGTITQPNRPRVAGPSVSSAGISDVERPTGGGTSAGRTGRVVESASTGRTTSGSTPVVFPAKLVIRKGRERRESNARLSFARDRLLVTPTADSEPVFSAPYGQITAIAHARQRGWKPPQKWSRVIKIGKDVLNTLGVRDRHEISVHAESELVVVRIDDEIVNRVMRTLKERTGLTPEIVKQR